MTAVRVGPMDATGLTTDELVGLALGVLAALRPPEEIRAACARIAASNDIIAVYADIYEGANASEVAP